MITIRERIVPYFSKIEFWIALFFLLRLIGITSPPIETAHNWRQVTGLMVTRNFLEINSNIFFPRIDDNQGLSGIIGMEFPIMNYIHFLIAKIFGFYSWHGRLINLIVSSFGILFFYKIIKQLFSSPLALYSSIALLTSSWFIFSRKIMPDTFCISLVFIGLYYGIQYLLKGKNKFLILYIIFITLALLSKIPALIYLLIFLIVLPFWNTGKSSKRKYFISIVSVIPILCCVLWYFIWNPYLSETYGNWYNIGQSFSEGFIEIKTHLLVSFKRFYFYSFRSYVLFILTLLGAFFMVYKKEKLGLILFSLGSLIFSGYVIKSGYFFHHHSYYILPFVPIMSFCVGYGLNSIRQKKIIIVLLLASVIESISNQQHDLFTKQSELYKTELESIADSFSSPEDLIAINGNGNPQQIYFTHRKGWTIEDSDIKNESFINQITKEGCKFLIINKNQTNLRLDNRSIVHSDENFISYYLN